MIVEDPERHVKARTHSVLVVCLGDVLRWIDKCSNRLEGRTDELF
jgi:hypothetical protein